MSRSEDTSSGVPDIHGSSRPDHVRLKALIYSRAVGRDNAVSSRELANHLSVERTTVRDIVQDLVADGALIASCPHGYYRIAKETEFRAEMRSLREQIETTRERAQTLSAEWYRMQAGEFDVKQDVQMPTDGGGGE